MSSDPALPLVTAYLRHKLVIEPAELTVKAGETITLRNVNSGQLPHDFTLGDQVTQDEHEQAMTGMTMPDEANAVVGAAGETRELTWHFTEAGAFLIGYHQPGHYAAGMKGEITVRTHPTMIHGHPAKGDRAPQDVASCTDRRPHPGS